MCGLYSWGSPQSIPNWSQLMELPRHTPLCLLPGLEPSVWGTCPQDPQSMLCATVHDQVAAGPYPVWDRAAALSPSLLVLGCSSEPSLPGPCCHCPKLWPPRFQVMAPTPHCPADLMLLWAPLPRSWHPALVGHHWRYAAAVLHLPPGARVWTLTCCSKAVLLLHPTLCARDTTASCHPKDHDTAPSSQARVTAASPREQGLGSMTDLQAPAP